MTKSTKGWDWKNSSTATWPLPGTTRSSQLPRIALYRLISLPEFAFNGTVVSELPWICRMTGKGQVGWVGPAAKQSPRRTSLPEKVAAPLSNRPLTERPLTDDFRPAPAGRPQDPPPRGPCSWLVFLAASSSAPGCAPSRATGCPAAGAPPAAGRPPLPGRYPCGGP